MGNFAFTTTLILLLALPGYLFRACYYSGEFTRQLLSRAWTDDLAKAILYSVPFHVIALAVFELLQHTHRITHTLYAELPFRVLADQYSDPSNYLKGSVAGITGALYSNQLYIVTYYGFVLVLAFLCGHCLRHLVWEYELDVKWPAVFRFKSEWIYQLMGRGKLFVRHPNRFCRMIGMAGPGSIAHKTSVVILDAVTDQPSDRPGKTQLYSGIVAGFTVDEKGGLSEIVLTKAKRGKFLKKTPFAGSDFILETIPGRAFLLRYSAVKNLNLTYLPVP